MNSKKQEQIEKNNNWKLLRLFVLIFSTLCKLVHFLIIVAGTTEHNLVSNEGRIYGWSQPWRMFDEVANYFNFTPKDWKKLFSPQHKKLKVKRHFKTFQWNPQGLINIVMVETSFPISRGNRKKV